MKYFLPIVLLFTVSCTLPQQLLRPAVPVTYGPETLLIVIADIQDTAIAREQAQELPTVSARKIIQFTVDTAKLVKSAPTNMIWKELIAANLAQLRKDLPVPDEAKFAGKFNLVQKIVTSR